MKVKQVRTQTPTAETTKGSAKFVAVREPFRFRVVPSGIFEDIKGQFEDGKVVFAIDEPTEVESITYKTGRKVKDDKGQEADETKTIDVVARCREFCVIGRLAEVSDDTPLPVPAPDGETTETDGEGNTVRRTRKGR